MTGILNIINEYAILILAVITTFLAILEKFSKVKKPLTKIFNYIGRLFNEELISKIEHLENKIDKNSNEVEELKKTNDFNHATEIKLKMVSLKKLQEIGEYLDEDQWRRYFEQEKRYKFLKKKYPDELNGHMEIIMEFMKKQYIKGNITLDLPKD